MASTGDCIEHPITGERIIFRKTAADTNGELLQMEFTMSPHGFVAGEHIHPNQEERFNILSGDLTFRVSGKERKAGAGDQLTVPAGTPHIWWNSGDTEASLIIEFRPALRIEEFFETLFGLAQDGKVDKRTGLPNFLILGLIFREYEKEICPALIPARVLFNLLASVGAWRGYQGTYPYPR